MKRYSRREIAERAGKTFIQGFIGSLAVTLPNTDWQTKGVWQSLFIGALASGLSAVMNWFSNYLDKDINIDENEVIENDDTI